MSGLRPKTLGDPDAPRLDDDFHKHPLAERPLVARDTVDGMPKVITNVDASITQAPPLVLEHFICAGDHSEYLLRGKAGRELRFPPSIVHAGGDRYWVEVGSLSDQQSAEALELLLETGRAVRVPSVDGQVRWLTLAAFVSTVTALVMGISVHAIWFVGLSVPVILLIGAWTARAVHRIEMRGQIVRFEVEPRRRQCRNYRRQLSDHQGDPEHRSMNRYCIAMRDENGEFVSLRDSRLYACELREPRHAPSEVLLDDFDQKATAEARKETDEFDVEAALRADIGRGGIFKD